MKLKTHFEVCKYHEEMTEAVALLWINDVLTETEYYKLTKRVNVKCERMDKQIDKRNDVRRHER